MDKIIVSVVMPIRNEERYIADCIESLLRQDFPAEQTEWLLVDGASEDRTAEIVLSYAREHPGIRLLRNPEKTVPYAMNTAIRAAKGLYIVRLDAHSAYASDYISMCVRYLEETGADNVGGPMNAAGKNTTQKVVAAAYASPFALGGGAFHDKSYEGEADTVYLGAFQKSTLFAVGLFDERFTRNQDDELNLRIVASGGKIFCTPKIRSVYYPRSTLTGLFDQYRQYGYWKAAVIKKHQRPARLSHLVPAMFVLFIVLGGLCALLHPLAAAAYGAVWALYLLLDGWYTFTNPALTRFTDRCLLLWVHFLLHSAYGVGFLQGAARFATESFESVPPVQSHAQQESSVANHGSYTDER